MHGRRARQHTRPNDAGPHTQRGQAAQRQPLNRDTGRPPVQPPLRCSLARHTHSLCRHRPVGRRIPPGSWPCSTTARLWTRRRARRSTLSSRVTPTSCGPWWVLWHGLDAAGVVWGARRLLTSRALTARSSHSGASSRARCDVCGCASAGARPLVCCAATLAALRRVPAIRTSLWSPLAMLARCSAPCAPTLCPSVRHLAACLLAPGRCKPRGD
jgi:hypothetical protein